MKKIAIVIAHLGVPGGAEKVAADLAEEFSERGYEVTIITFDETASQKYWQPSVKSHIHLQLPAKKGGLFTQISLLLQRAWAFRKLFKQEQFDHIFSFLEAANVPCALASRRSTLSMHLDPNVMTKKEWFIVKWLYPYTHRIVAVSKHMQTVLQDKAKLPNVSCIYNPIHTAHIHEKAKEAIDIPSDRPFIVAVGRLTEQKRFDRLLVAYAATKMHQKVRLVIVGDGHLHEKLKQQISDLDLDEHVVLAGYQANPYKYMQRAEFLVMSSDHEGYPLTLLEALTLKCPPIAMDCPTGPCEIISHGENGLLVAHKDIAALTRAMDKLFVNQALLQKLRSQAPASVEQNDIRPVADAWLAV